MINGWIARRNDGDAGRAAAGAPPAGAAAAALVPGASPRGAATPVAGAFAGASVAGAPAAPPASLAGASALGGGGFGALVFFFSRPSSRRIRSRSFSCGLDCARAPLSAAASASAAAPRPSTTRARPRARAAVLSARGDMTPSAGRALDRKRDAIVVATAARPTLPHVLVREPHRRRREGRRVATETPERLVRPVREQRRRYRGCGARPHA